MTELDIFQKIKQHTIQNILLNKARHNLLAEDMDGIKKLAQQGFDFNQPLDFKSRAIKKLHPIGLACYKNNTQMFQFFIEQGVELNVRSHTTEETPLIITCLKNNQFLMRQLLENGADPHFASSYGDTPLLASVLKGNKLQKKQKINVLFEYGLDVDSICQNKETNPLIKETYTNDYSFENIDILLDSGCQSIASNNNFNCLMAASCKSNRPDLIQFWIDQGNDIHCQFNELNLSPLLFATLNDYPYQNTQCLLENGADPNIVNSAGDIPLFYIMKHKTKDKQEQLDTFDLLMQYGTNIDHQNEDQLTPLILAIAMHDEILVDKVLSYKPDPTIVNKRNQTAMGVATLMGYKNIRQKIKQYASNYSDKMNETNEMNTSQSSKKIKMAM